MSNPIPNLLALTSIADGSPQQAAPLRNNYAAIQAAVNALATALKGGTAGALLYATDASDVAYLPDAPNDGDVLKWVAAASRWEPAANASGAGTQLDYKQITADAATTSHNTEGAADTIIDGNSVTYDGTRVKVEIYAPQIINAAGNTGPATAVLLRDTTVIGQVVLTQGLGVTTAGGFAYGVAFDTPSAAAHVYKWHLFGGGTATYTVKAGAGVAGALAPAFIRVTKA